MILTALACPPGPVPFHTSPNSPCPRSSVAEKPGIGSRALNVTADVEGWTMSIDPARGRLRGLESRHGGKIRPDGDIKIFRQQLERNGVVATIVAHLRQQVARVAAALGTGTAPVMSLQQVVHSLLAVLAAEFLAVQPEQQQKLFVG